MKHKVLVNQKGQSIVCGHNFFNWKRKRILGQNRGVSTVAYLHHLVDAMCKMTRCDIGFQCPPFFFI